MASYTLEEILGTPFLTGVIEAVKTGIPEVLPKQFWSVTGDVIKDQGRYTQYSGTRQTLPRSEYGSQPPRVELSPVGVKDVKLATISGAIELDMTTYIALRGYDSLMPQEIAIQEIKRQIAQFRARLDNTKISLVHSMLALGHIYFDSSGNLLPTSSGAFLDINYNVGANNLNQLNSAITADWATAGTDIPGNIRQLKLNALKLTGYPLKYAFYGRDIPSYIMTNNYVKDWVIRNNYNQPMMDTPAELPPGLLGLTWIPAYECFFADQNNTNQTWFPNDQITFTPEITNSVYEYMSGQHPVPTSFQPFPEMMGAPNSFDMKRGMWSYGVAKPNFTAEIMMGEVMLPVWKVPDALFIADVHF